MAVLLAAGKAPAFPFRTARHHHRNAAAVKGQGHVQVRHAVEAQLDQFADRRGVAAAIRSAIDWPVTVSHKSDLDIKKASSTVG